MSRELERLLDQLGHHLDPDEVDPHRRVHAAAETLGLSTRRLSDKLRRKHLTVAEAMELLRRWSAAVGPVFVGLDAEVGFLLDPPEPEEPTHPLDRFIADRDSPLAQCRTALDRMEAHLQRVRADLGYDRLVCLRATTMGGVVDAHALGRVVQEAIAPGMPSTLERWQGMRLSDAYLRLLADVTTGGTVRLQADGVACRQLRSVYRRDDVVVADVAAIVTVESSFWYLSGDARTMLPRSRTAALGSHTRALEREVRRLEALLALADHVAFT